MRGERFGQEATTGRRDTFIFTKMQTFCVHLSVDKSWLSHLAVLQRVEKAPSVQLDIWRRICLLFWRTEEGIDFPVVVFWLE